MHKYKKNKAIIIRKQIKKVKARLKIYNFFIKTIYKQKKIRKLNQDYIILNFKV